MIRPLLLPGTLSCLFVFFVVLPMGAADLATQLRRPVALASSADNRWLYVANRDSGTLSVIALPAQQVVAEYAIGKRLSAVQRLPNLASLLVADEGAHQLIRLEFSGQQIEVRERLTISPYPISIEIAPDGSQATVASLWSRRLTFVALGGKLEPIKTLDLPFAPRCQLTLAKENRLIVADSFGGKLALVDPERREVVGQRAIPGHNIRGLGVSPDGGMLLAAHQMLNELAHSIRNDIHWGLLMSNDLRWLKVDSLLAGGELLYHGAHMHPLGDAGRGGGDPGGVAVAAGGTVVVAISGVDEVALGKEGDFAMQRVKVGRRPTTVALSSDGKTAYVANTFADSISVVDVIEKKAVATISLGPAPELSPAQRGELLFHDARLSHDSWMSCQSCHTEGHSNGQMNDNFSDRSFGAPKRVLSLLGVKDTLPLAWNGQVQTLERQVHNSVETTMQREETLPREQVQALAAYLETLEPPPPLDKLRETADSAAIERGRLVFERRDCATCHAPPSYTTPSAYDVGIHDIHGVKEFNPPSLIGLSHRDTFFHDNRAESLADVFLRHGHPGKSGDVANELADLMAFLQSL